MKDNGGQIRDDIESQLNVKTYVRHDKENNRTIGIVVNGFNVHVGIAKRHPEDQLNRRLGRQIALGRAMRALKVYEGLEELREADESRPVPLFFTLCPDSEEQTKQAVEDLISGAFWEET